MNKHSLTHSYILALMLPLSDSNDQNIWKNLTNCRETKTHRQQQKTNKQNKTHKKNKNPTTETVLFVGSQEKVDDSHKESILIGMRGWHYPLRPLSYPYFNKGCNKGARAGELNGGRGEGESLVDSKEGGERETRVRE